MATITEDYVSFETAKLLRDKGFDKDWADGSIEKYLNGTEGYSLPTLAATMKWLREVHNVHIGINPISGKGYNATIYDVADFDDYGIISDTEFFFHVEDACEAAIKYCLEHLI